MHKCCNSHLHNKVIYNEDIEAKAQSDEVTALRSLSKLCVLVPDRIGFIFAVDGRVHG